MGIGQLIG